MSKTALVFWSAAGLELGILLQVGPFWAGIAICILLAVALYLALIQGDGQDMPATRAALVSLLAQVEDGDVLFIDETHAVPGEVLELLYTAVEGRFIDLVIRQETISRTIRLKVAPFTLIAATTDEAHLPKPLLSRLVVRIELDPFNEEDTRKYLQLEARRNGLDIEPGAEVLFRNASQRRERSRT